MAWAQHMGLLQASACPISSTSDHLRPECTLCIQSMTPPANSLHASLITASCNLSMAVTSVPTPC